MSDEQIAEAILCCIGDHYGKMGTSPSVREIKTGVRIASTSKIQAALFAMAKAGMLEKPEDGQHRGWRLSEEGRVAYELRKSIVRREIKRFHVGRVRAGAMIQEWQDVLGGQSSALYFDPDDQDIIEVSLAVLPNRGEDIFALRVAGDSMVDAMINEGDIVLVQKQQGGALPREGAMVVARDRLDGNAVTLKHFHDKGDEIELRPANRDYKPIRIARQQIDILGTVLMVLRWPRPSGLLAAAA